MKTMARQFLTIFTIWAPSTGAAYAKKPESPGNSGQHKVKHQQNDDRNDQDSQGYYRDDYRSDRHFGDDERSAIRRYYSEHRSSKGCPPGLAKKGNGCRPPGQAKQWHRGDRLPDDVVYYDLPHALLHELGRTREGQKLIRVGTDILLINAATHTVIDAIDDLDNLF